MSGKAKNIIIASSIIGALVIVTTAVLIGRRKRKLLEDRIKNNNVDVTEQSKQTDSQVVFPLQKGMGYDNVAENNAIRVVQRYLNAKIAENSYIGYSILSEDGKFGTKTEEALVKIAGVKTVGWSLYQVMLKELTPTYLSNSEKTDPKINMFDYTMGLFD